VRQIVFATLALLALLPPSASFAQAKKTPTPTPATKTPAAPKPPALAARRPIVLDALRVEGRTDAPRVLFVHAGPTVALEDAPTHPTYMRDDYTAALSSPVRVRVRSEALPRTTAGGTR